MKRQTGKLQLLLVALAVNCGILLELHWPAAAQAQSWEQIVAAGKKEGRVVVAISPSAELRQGIEQTFEKRFGIDAELSPGAGGGQARKIVEESKAGVSYFDLMVGGTTSTVDLLEYGVLQPVGPHLIVPDVKEPKYWWGGHMYADKAKQFIFSPLAYMTESVWYNKSHIKPGDIRSYDDLLHPKWKGKIGFHDPRVAGSGSGVWSFLWLIKGESYLEKLAKQDLLILADRRQLAEAVAKGRVYIGIGSAYFSYLPFLKAGLPVDALVPEEGSQGSHGSGNIVVVKNQPHPNASKVFINWLLSKEGQEVFTKAMGQATRRLDVDTKWLSETGVTPAKDSLTVEQFRKNELSSQERLEKVRAPAERAAERLLK
jgi:iron(III) transport system substrate-binding protein